MMRSLGCCVRLLSLFACLAVLVADDLHLRSAGLNASPAIDSTGATPVAPQSRSSFSDGGQMPDSGVSSRLSSRDLRKGAFLPGSCAVTGAMDVAMAWALDAAWMQEGGLHDSSATSSTAPREENEVGDCIATGLVTLADDGDAAIRVAQSRRLTWYDADGQEQPACGDSFDVSVSDLAASLGFETSPGQNLCVEYACIDQNTPRVTNVRLGTCPAEVTCKGVSQMQKRECRREVAQAVETIRSSPEILSAAEQKVKQCSQFDRSGLVDLALTLATQFNAHAPVPEYCGLSLDAMEEAIRFNTITAINLTVRCAPLTGATAAAIAETAFRENADHALRGGKYALQAPIIAATPTDVSSSLIGGEEGVFRINFPLVFQSKVELYGRIELAREDHRVPSANPMFFHPGMTVCMDVNSVVTVGQFSQRVYENLLIFGHPWQCSDLLP